MAKKKKASLADTVKNTRLKQHIRMHERIIDNPGKIFGTGESGQVPSATSPGGQKYEKGLTGDAMKRHQDFLKKNVEHSRNELKRLTDPKTEESYNLEDKEVRERKASERKDPTVAKKKDKSSEMKAPDKPANAPKAEENKKPAKENKPAASKEKKPRGRPKKAAPAVDAAVEKASKSMENADSRAPSEKSLSSTAKKEEAPTETSATSDEKSTPRNFGKNPKLSIWDDAKAAGGGLSFGELPEDTKTSGGTGKPRNFGANKGNDGGYWAEERKASAERASRANVEYMSTDDWNKDTGLVSEPGKAPTKSPLADADGTMRSEDPPASPKGPTVTSVDPASSSAGPAPKGKGRIRSAIEAYRDRRRNRGAAAGAPPSTPPTPAAGGGATPPTPPAGGGAPAGGRSGAFQGGHSAFNNAGAIQGNTFQGNIEGGVTAGSPFSTNNQTINYGGGAGGGLPSTITNSGRATGGGKGGAVSNSGVATNHPRAKNAARGGRRTTKNNG